MGQIEKLDKERRQILLLSPQKESSQAVTLVTVSGEAQGRVGLEGLIHKVLLILRKHWVMTFQ